MLNESNLDESAMLDHSDYDIDDQEFDILDHLNAKLE